MAAARVIAQPTVDRSYTQHVVQSALNVCRLGRFEFLHARDDSRARTWRHRQQRLNHAQAVARNGDQGWRIVGQATRRHGVLGLFRRRRQLGVLDEHQFGSE